MRGVVALAPLIVASGCLYLGRINHAPEVSLTASAQSAHKGTPFIFNAGVSDDEDAPSTLKVLWTVLDETGAKVLPCDYAAPDPQGGLSYSVTFLRAGVFTVTAQTADHFGALSNTATVMVIVDDAAPQFSAGGMITETTAPTACQAYVAGRSVPLTLKDSVMDPDAVAGSCNGATPPLTLTWRITASPTGAHPVLTTYDAVAAHCNRPTSTSTTELTPDSNNTQVCLWTDAAIMTPMAAYTIVVEASDGNSVVTSADHTVAVEPNQPPCITGETPAIGSYVVDRTQPQVFDVNSAIDDQDAIGAGLTFQWSVSTKSNPQWVVVPNYGLQTYTLDPSSFGVGEIVYVRVEAFDSSMPPLSGASVCAATQSDCNMPSCVLAGQACHKWRTWDLELR